MRFLPKIILPAVLLAPALNAAQSFTAGIEPFRSLSSFDQVLMDLEFRFAPMAGTTAAGDATHVLLRGLRALDADSDVYESGYEAINLDAGTRLDVGTVYMQLPDASLPENSVASPIVGVVRRDGPWDDYGPQTPQGTTVGGASGISTYDPETETISLSLSRNGQTISGTVNYTVVDTETLVLEGPEGLITLTAGGDMYNFHETVLYREGGRFYGVMQSADLSVSYDSLLFAVEFSGFPDVDGDGIPDIVDPEAEFPPLDLEVGTWVWDARIGYLRAANDRWAESQQLGWVYYEAFPWVYHLDLGWIGYVRHDIVANPEGTQWTYFQQDGYFVWFWSTPEEAESFFYFSNASDSGWESFAGGFGEFPFPTL
ncbi:MAG: hypothetical protein JJU00_12360 [Opitutales bacterium]|nr:hypothetical protein [Opitutales bacterium]